MELNKNTYKGLHNRSVMVGVLVIVITLTANVLGNYFFKRGHYAVPWVVTGLLVLLIILYIYFLKRHRQTVRDLLVTVIDLETYQRFFDYEYKNAILYRKKGALQESYIADGQCYYFYGEFLKSIQILEEVDVQKAPWNTKRVVDETKAYYLVANAINLKDFSSIDEKIELFSRCKGKNVEQLTRKLQAMHTVVSGGVTDYFQMEKPKYKLFQIEASYFQGLNLLNQDKKAEAKECFTSIVNENPDLFYVQEAKRYVEELD